MTPIDELIGLIEEVSGIVVPDRDRATLARVAAERAQAGRHESVERYVRALRSNLEGGDWHQLLSRITVKESYLFRAPQHFRALSEAVIPRLVGRRSTARLRVSGREQRGEDDASAGWPVTYA